MANTVTVTKIMEGPRHAVFHIYLKSDGVAGELTDQTLIDPTADLSPAGTASASLTVEKIWYSNVGFDSILEFDATADTPIWKIPAVSDSNKIDFKEVGGLKDRSGAGATGKITITTSGFTAATDEGTMIIRIRKD